MVNPLEMSFQYLNYKSNFKLHLRRQNAECHSKSISTNFYDKTWDDCNGKHLNQYNEQITLNVGGTKFRIFKSNFSSHPGTRLSRLIRAKNDMECLVYCDDIMHSSIENGNKEYFFHRSPQIFNYILDIYRDGMLHSPLGICTIQLNEELKYWGIDDELFEPCCALRYHQNLKDNKAQEKRFINLNNSPKSANINGNSESSRFKKIRTSLKSMIENLGGSRIVLVSYRIVKLVIMVPE